MNRMSENDNRGVRSEAVTPEDQAIMTAPRANLFSFISRIFKNIYKILYMLYLVCSCRFCDTVECPLFLIKILPRGIVDNKIKASEIVAGIFKHIDDSFVYETLDDAIVELKDIVPNIIENIKPENLFLFFAERGEAFDHAISDNYEFKKMSKERVYMYCKKNYTGRGRNKEKKTEYIAIIFCKIKETKEIENIFGQKYKNGTKYGEYYKITWPEFCNKPKYSYDYTKVHYLDQPADIF